MAAESAKHRTPESDEILIMQLGETFLEELLAGRKPDRTALLRDNPSIAARLERRLALIDLLVRAGLPHGP